MMRHSVLSVEDSDTDFMALKCALRAAGVTAPLRRLASGRAALSWMNDAPSCKLEDRTSLVLLDLNLPGVDGFQLLKTARQRDPQRRVPIIVLTTSSHPRDIAASYAAGADAYMVKPLALEDWETKVGPLTDYWLKTKAGPGAGKADPDSDAEAQHRQDIAELTRAIEREIIPRLLLAHENDAKLLKSYGRFMTQEDAVAELARLAIEKDVPELAAFIEAARADAGIDALFQQLIAPASRLIGDLWKTDRCSFEQFSRALTRLQQLLVELNPEQTTDTRH